MDDVPQIVFRCDIETFVQVVHGHLPLDQARASGQLSVEGGQNVWGGEVGEQADSLLESLVRELGNRFTRSLLMTKPNTDMVAGAGEHYVAAEINWRGAYASPWSGNLPDIDIVGDGQSAGRRDLYPGQVKET